MALNVLPGEFPSTASVEVELSIYWKLRWYFGLRWKRYVAAIAALYAVAALVLVPPWVTGRVVDAVAKGALTMQALLSYVAILAFVAVAVYVLRYAWRTMLYGASFRLAALLRERIYRHLTLMPPGFFQRHKTGDLMARATNDVTAVEQTAGEGVLSLFDGTVTGIFVLIMLSVALSWKLTLLALLPFPAMAYFMWRYGSEMHASFQAAQARFSDLTDKTQEAITNIRLIKAFGHEDKQLNVFAEATEAAAQANLRVARVDSRYEPTVHLTVGSSFFLTVAGGAWLIAHGEMTVGQLTSFTMYLGYLTWPMFAVGWVLNIVERGSAAYERIEQLLNTPAVIADAGERDVIDRPDISMQIRRFAYETGRGDALADVRIEVPAGRTLGIVGPIGSGKTTLLRLLLRLYEDPEATIRVGGVPVQAYRIEALRRGIAVVPQEAFLFSTTVADNIALGRPEAGAAEIRDAARQACIADDIERFGDGYDTMVGERGITLSGGQKQRVAIARALLLDAPVLVLDDALSAVDGATERAILRALRTARKARTTLIVSHRLSAVADADEIVVLSHGRVLERGTHEQLLAHDGWYAQMFRYQQLERRIEGAA
jgi:ABC-type multidrug transport system fused ATPase/permease subunit